MASFKNVVEQLAMVSVEEPLYDPRAQASFHIFEEVHGSPARALPEGALALARTLVVWTSLLGLIAIAIWAAATKDKSQAARQALAVITILVVVFAANAVLTGAISGPHPRYQARLVWVLPATFLLLGAALATRLLTNLRASNSGRGTSDSTHSRH